VIGKASAQAYAAQTIALGTAEALDAAYLQHFQNSVLGYRAKEQLTQDIKKIMSEQEQCLANASKMK